MIILKENKEAIYKVLIKEWLRIKSSQDDAYIKLLDRVWGLRGKPPENHLFVDAYDEILYNHLTDEELTSDQLFQDKLKVFGDESIFKSFTEAILSPENYMSIDELSGPSLSIDSILTVDNLALVTTGFNEAGLPIQKITLRSEDGHPPFGIKQNVIPFYVVKESDIVRPGEVYFLLYPNKNWSDFSIVSIFNLNYHDANNQKYHVGRLKIIYKEGNETWRRLPDVFTQLSEDYCSLSGELQYYLSLRDRFNVSGLISVLYALQDAAYFHEIGDRFEHNSNYSRSLMKENNYERMLRDLKPQLQGLNLFDRHRFTYVFQPSYSKVPVKIDFKFNNEHPIPNRIIAVIGKNGTGKTQLVTALPISFLKNAISDFDGKIPSFTKIIAVSYSVFDNFNIPKRTGTFDYVYCGLKDEDGDLRSNKGLTISFHNNWKKIDSMRRLHRWRNTLASFIDEDLLDAFILPSDDETRDFQVSVNGFQSIKNQLSSGQSILLFMITQVVANIRLDSLILYDEPETHLHPNAIVELVNTIYRLVNEFESYCIIATHSPLVIREIFSKNVFVLERENNVPSIRRIGIESFGENLGVLSDEVFGDREVEKQYKSIIKSLVTKGSKFEDILALLEFDDVPLSLNARIYISNLIRQQDEEH